MATAKRKAGSAAESAKTAAKPPAGRAAAKRVAARRPVPKPAAKKPAAKKAAARKTAKKKPAAKQLAAVQRATGKAAAAAPRKAPASKRPAKDVRAARSRAPKTYPTDASVLAFLERVPDPAMRADCVALNALLSQVTAAPPRMWGASIVGFGQYRYRYSSGHEGDWPVCGYSPRKQNLTVYVMAGFERFPELMRRLGRYKTGKSCLYLDRLSDIDTGVLRELVAASNEQLRRMYG
jgi:hypothetical protein